VVRALSSVAGTHLRGKPITVADGVTEAYVAHCELILERLRLFMQQMKLAMKQLDRTCFEAWQRSQDDA
jgi:hypothetical protein